MLWLKIRSRRGGGLGVFQRYYHGKDPGEDLGTYLGDFECEVMERPIPKGSLVEEKLILGNL
eukprot:12279594-Prorocentrum_lima.AAC.1